MDALRILVSQSLGDLSVREAAERCGLPEHRLSDIVYGRSKRPHPEVLAAIEAGLGISYDRLALAAYGRVTEPPEASVITV